MNDMINFEGKEIKPWKDGKYRCPFACHRSDYPRPKWGTKKGFLKHLESCPQTPSAVERRSMSSAENNARYEAMKAEILAEFPYKIGDVLHCVRDIIVKPTHVKSSTGKMRHVRYEAEIRFEPYTFELKSIDFAGEGITDGITKEFVLNNRLLLNGLIGMRRLCKSKEEAELAAKEAQIAYDAHVKFSSDCR
jgi:hypothetical protein